MLFPDEVYNEGGGKKKEEAHADGCAVGDCREGEDKADEVKPKQKTEDGGEKRDQGLAEEG